MTEITPSNLPAGRQDSPLSQGGEHAPPAVIKPKIGKNALSLWSIFAAILLSVLFGMAYLVSESGFLSIPFFSKYYRGPVPIRRIDFQPMDSDTFRVVLSSRLLNALNSGTPPYRIRVTERELSGVLSMGMGEAFRDQAWTGQDLQMAITPQFLEIYGRFSSPPLRLETRARFLSIMEGGGLKLKPIDVRLGDLPIHPEAATRLASMIFSRDFGAWRISLGDIRLKSVELQDGYLELIISPSK